MAEMVLRATGSKLKIISEIHVTSTQAQYDTCLFEFDEAWDGYEMRTAVFYSNPNNIKAMLLDTNNMCFIPWDAFSHSRYLYIGVYGNNGSSYLPTQFVEVMYQPGANLDDHLYPPTPGIYEQIAAGLSHIQNSVNSKASKAELNAAVNVLTNKTDALEMNKEDKTAVQALEMQVRSLSSGGPKGIYETLSALQVAKPAGDTGIYVVSADGQWYYWSGSSWTAGGVYQGIAIADSSVTPQKTNFAQMVTSVNRLDMQAPGVKHGYMISDTYTEVFNSSFSISDYIPCRKNDVLRWQWIDFLGGGNSITFFNAAKQPVGRTKQAYFTPIDGIVTYTVSAGITAEDIVWARFNVSRYRLDNMVTVNHPMPTSFVPYVDATIKPDYGLNTLQLTQINPLAGKTALFAGDSICKGESNGGGYARLISERNRMHAVNYGVNGASLSVQSDRTAIATTMVSGMSNSADYVIFEGGINDCSLSVPLGDVSPGYSYEFDTTTITGALEAIFYQSQTKWPGKKVGFIIVYQVHSSINTITRLTAFRGRAIEVCRKWAIPVLDLFSESGLVNARVEINNMFFENADYFHVNATGYEVITPKIEAWMKTL